MQVWALVASEPQGFRPIKRNANHPGKAFQPQPPVFKPSERRRTMVGAPPIDYNSRYEVRDLESPIFSAPIPMKSSQKNLRPSRSNHGAKKSFAGLSDRFETDDISMLPKEYLDHTRKPLHPLPKEFLDHTRKPLHPLQSLKQKYPKTNDYSNKKTDYRTMMLRNKYIKRPDPIESLHSSSKRYQNNDLQQLLHYKNKPKKSYYKELHEFPGMKKLHQTDGEHLKINNQKNKRFYEDEIVKHPKNWRNQNPRLDNHREVSGPFPRKSLFPNLEGIMRPKNLEYNKHDKIRRSDALDNRERMRHPFEKYIHSESSSPDNDKMRNQYRRMDSVLPPVKRSDIEINNFEDIYRMQLREIRDFPRHVTKKREVSKSDFNNRNGNAVSFSNQNLSFNRRAPSQISDTTYSIENAQPVKIPYPIVESHPNHRYGMVESHTNHRYGMVVT